MNIYYMFSEVSEYYNNAEAEKIELAENMNPLGGVTLALKMQLCPGCLVMIRAGGVVNWV